MNVSLLNSFTSQSDTSIVFTFVPEVFPLSISISHNSDFQIADVVIIGSGFFFEHGWMCGVNSLQASAYIFNKFRLTCSFPIMEPLSGYLIVFYPGSSLIRTDFFVSLFPPAKITNASPLLGSTSGGTQVFIELSKLYSKKEYVCMFGYLESIAHVFNSTHLMCESPAQHMIGSVYLRVRYNDIAANISNEGIYFYVFDPPYITEVRQISIASSKNYLISVFGANFLNTVFLTCRCGPVTSPARWISSSLLECVVPYMVSDHMNVEISNNAVDFTSNGLIVKIFPQLPIASQTAQKIPVISGSLILLQGSDFPSSRLICLFHENYFDAVHLDKYTAACFTKETTMTEETIKICSRFSYCTEDSRIDQTQKQCKVDDMVVIGDINTEHFVRSKIANSCNSNHPTFLLEDSKFDSRHSSSIVIKDINPERITAEWDDFLHVTVRNMKQSGRAVCVFVPFSPIFVDSIQIPGIWISKTELWCNISGLIPNKYSLHIGYDEKNLSLNDVTIEVGKPNQIVDYFPQSGSINGGSIITITGSKLEDLSEMYCYFGLNVVDAHFDANTSSAKCVSPPWNGIHEVFFSFPRIDDNFSTPKNKFIYTDSLAIMSIFPNVIETSRTYELSLHGYHFDEIEDLDSLRCRLGLLDYSVVYASFSIIKCNVCVHDEGIFFVELIYNDDVLDVSKIPLQVVSSAIILDVYPHWTTTNGGESVTVIGENFYKSENLKCFFDQNWSNGTWISSSQLECIVPPQKTGDYILTISNDGAFTNKNSHINMRSIHGIKIERIFPTRGKKGTIINLIGDFFNQNITLGCSFGGKEVLAQVLNKTFSRCRVPLLITSLQVDIQFTVNRIPIVTDVPFNFIFIDEELSIASISPSSGIIHGGTTVTISLHSALTNTTYHCKFGDIIVTAVSSDRKKTNEIVCISPTVSKTGDVYLEVSSDNVDYTSNHFQFRYVNSPVVSNFFPESGPESGGTAVIIEGANFASDVDYFCKFGLSLDMISGSWINEESIMCISPPLQPGHHEIRIFINEVEMKNLGFIFCTTNIPTILGISPTSGSSAGGTLVSVFGTSFIFSHFLKCRFGDSITDGIFVNENEISCSSPSQDSSLVDLQVSNNGVDFSVMAAQFKHYDQLSVFSFFPRSGPITGDTLITFEGENFQNDDEGFFCRFGENLSNVSYISKTVVSCKTPVVSSLRNVIVALVYSQDTYYMTETFTYTYSPKLFEVIPSYGASNIITSIIISGAFFIDENFLLCKFGDFPEVSSIFIDSNRIKCPLPLKISPAIFTLRIRGKYQQSYLIPTLYYEVTDKVEAVRLDRERVLRSGSDKISVIGKNFINNRNVACQFEEESSQDAFIVNSTMIQCVVPYSKSKNKRSVKVTVDGIPIVTDVPFNFIFIDEELSIASISPSSGIIHGGTTVTISLHSALTNTTYHCKFGDIIVTAVSSDRKKTNEIVCISPTVSKTGDVYLEVSSDNVDYTSNHFQFRYVNSPVVSNFFPESGPESGGTAVIIEGANFASDVDYFCKFGLSLDMISGSWINEESIMCISPPLQPGHHEIRIFISDLDFSNIGTFWVHRNIFLTSLSPELGIAQGGTDINVTGSGFSYKGSLSCVFGEIGSFVGTFISSSQVTCHVPRRSSKSFNSTSVEVWVTINGVQYSENSLNYRFFPEPLVEKISPLNGPCSGNTPVYVYGSNFLISSKNTLCLFGDNAVPAIVLSSTTLLCYAPKNKVGWVNLSISINGGADWTPSGHVIFEYLTAPSIRSFQPTSGSFRGGTLVRVMGNNFHPSSSLMCKFGNLNASKSIWISETRVDCETPSHVPGSVPVQITNNQKDYYVSTAFFKFIGNPRTLAITPSTGPSTGGTKVLVSGVNFISSESNYCKFGDYIVDAIVIESTMMECEAPRLVSSHTGPVDFRVSSNAAYFTTDSVPFTYTDSPILSHTNPSFGAISGGDRIHIIGNNFNESGEAWCRFGLSSIVKASIVNETLIYCKSPIWERSEKVTIDVTTNLGDWSENLVFFTYHKLPRVDLVYPLRGSHKGGTVIYIIGSLFPAFEKLSCHFGLSVVPATWKSDKLIRCESPPFPVPMNVPISLGIDEKSWYMTEFSFSAIQEHDIHSISPVKGSSIGGTVVSLHGRHFVESPFLSCKFGHSIVPARFINSNRIQCISPQHKPGIYKIQSSTNGIDFSEEAFHTTYSFTLPISVQKLEPDIGPISGTRINVIGSNFHLSPNLKCVVNDEEVDAIYSTRSQIQCMFPPQQIPSSALVHVKSDNFFLSLEPLNFRFTPEITISSVSPVFLPWRTVTPLLVTGANFLDSPSLVCSFGDGYGKSVARWLSSSLLLCNSPLVSSSSTEAFLMLSISNNGGHNFSRNSLRLDMAQRVLVESVYPSSGVSSGGTEIALVVHGMKIFRKPSCIFDSVRVPAVLGTSKNIVYCETPPHLPGYAKLQLTTDGINSIDAEMFQFVSPPKVQRISPNLGPSTGGTRITVFGSHLKDVKFCRFYFRNLYRIDVPATSFSESEITCASPPLEDTLNIINTSYYTIELSINGVDYSDDRMRFSFHKKHRLLSISPEFGPHVGGSTVLIRGRNFLDMPNLLCRFGSMNVNAIFISETLISCKSPRASIGEVNVSISSNSVDFSSDTVLFRYYPSSSLKSIYPLAGPVIGGTTTILKGVNFFFSSSLGCRFGKYDVPATYINENTISCVSPSVMDEGKVNVSYTLNGQTFHDTSFHDEVFFEYTQSLQILSISPEQGWKLGGTEIFIVTNKVHQEPQLTLSCVFGRDKRTRAEYVNEDLVKCISPKKDITEPSKVQVSLQYENSQVLFYGPTFTYMEEVIISQIIPAFGSRLGGTPVNVYGINIVNDSNLLCLFGESAVQAEFVSENHVICSSPARLQQGDLVSVRITSQSNSVHTRFSAATFEYLSLPLVHKVKPISGSINGGTTVDIWGSGFSLKYAHKLMCRFGINTKPVNAELINESLLRCITPAVADYSLVKNGTVLAISVNGGHDFESFDSILFHYQIPILMKHVQPKSGPTYGGTLVKMVVSSLDVFGTKDIQCKFGQLQAKGKIQQDGESTEVYCISPAAYEEEEGVVNLELQINGENAAMASHFFFRYYNPPIVTHVSPSFGFFSGGEEVKLHGIGFENSLNLNCRFGDMPSPKASWVSSTEIICIPPALQDFSRDKEVVIQVSNNGFDFSLPQFYFANERYTYKPPPQITLVRSTNIDKKNICMIEIRGKNLSGATLCRFGPHGSSVPVLESSFSTVKCRPSSLEDKFLGGDINLDIYLSFGFEFLPMGLQEVYNEDQVSRGFESSKPETVISHPQLRKLYPPILSSRGDQWLTLYGDYFPNAKNSKCVFGRDTITNALFISSKEVRCKTPKMIPSKTFVEFFDGMSDMTSSNGLFVTFSKDSFISKIYPTFGSPVGGTVVTISGTFPFVDYGEKDRLEVLCYFGEFEVFAVSVSTNEIVCVSPPSSNLFASKTVQVTVGRQKGISYSNSFSWFEYVKGADIIELNPAHGNKFGGTHIIVTGSHFKNVHTLSCKFGDLNPVPATFISTRKLSCQSPPQSVAEPVEVEVSTNGQDFSSSRAIFTYLDSFSVSSIWPTSASVERLGKVTITGAGFTNTIQLSCSFGGVLVKAIFQSPSSISCRVPRNKPGPTFFQIIDDRFSNNANFTSQKKQFLYYKEPTIFDFHPKNGMIHGGTPVFIIGTNFFNTSSSFCRFDHRITRATILTRSLVLCPSPPRVDDSLSSHISISLNGIDFSQPSLERFGFETECKPGFYCGPSPGSWGNPAPNGTYISNSNALNFTLCEPGYFQPSEGKSNCLLCPISYICPDFGLSKPQVCPAGYICDREGLQGPSQACIEGHFCGPGTRTSDLNAFIGLRDWKNDAITGLVEVDRNHRPWSLVDRLFPATGSRRIEHPPIMDNVTAERPFACPTGYFCRSGVVNDQSVPLNFSTPQKCFDGFFCPRGSTSPEGSGPCPSGYYCPSQQLAVKCDVGHYCPGVGNVEPLTCYPGTYARFEAQTRCTRCEKGHICPGWGRENPILCPVGFVCDSTGLSSPFTFCPEGYFCEEGTSTRNPSGLGKTPKPCPPGIFCLGGVAHNITINWLPNQEEGSIAPQLCPEGHFCQEASSSPKGSGACFQGHYCPPGSHYPVEVPVGSFSRNEGSIVPSLCFPGTYSPIKASTGCRICPAGFTCQGYGTYVPRICKSGTYRSLADSITCKHCPSGTFSPFRGATDIGQCFPCPLGRVCGLAGMTDLHMSTPCPGGHVCGMGTDKRTQYDHKCPAGKIIFILF